MPTEHELQYFLSQVRFPDEKEGLFDDRFSYEDARRVASSTPQMGGAYLQALESAWSRRSGGRAASGDTPPPTQSRS